MSHNEDPYAQASSAYDTNAQAHTSNQRELEARILLKSNRMLKELINNWDDRPQPLLEETLNYNRQIWLLFYDTALENKDGGRPNDLRSNIVNLANFIFKKEIEIMANPDKKKLDILISINREIAAGLMTNQEAGTQETPPYTAPTNQAAPGTTTDISG